MENVVTDSEVQKRWYVVHAYSGFEKSVAQALRDRIARTGMQDKFGDVLVPTEEVVEMRSGQKRRSERKFFPGYVLVQIETHDEGGIPRIDSESWHLIKETSRVMGFIGGTADRPLPIRDEEADFAINGVLTQVLEQHVLIGGIVIIAVPARAQIIKDFHRADIRLAPPWIWQRGLAFHGGQQHAEEAVAIVSGQDIGGLGAL